MSNLQLSKVKARAREMVCYEGSFTVVSGSGLVSNVVGLGFVSVASGSSAGLYNVQLDDRYPTLLSANVQCHAALNPTGSTLPVTWGAYVSASGLQTASVAQPYTSIGQLISGVTIALISGSTVAWPNQSMSVHVELNYDNTVIPNS